jgi:hypothetical protein
MVFLSPEGTSQEREHPLAPRRFQTLDGLRLGLLGNTKLNADEVLEAVGDLLQQRFKISSVTMRTKPTFSRPASSELVEELRQSSDIVLTGVGD